MPGTVKKNAQERLLQRLGEIKERGILRRDASLGAIDVEARTVVLSFSSEVEYERWFGIEVLGHDAHEVDLSRLNNDSPLLWMHDWRDQRGVVVRDSVSIGDDKKGRCTVRFSRSEAGERLFQDVQDGIITKVSVGYGINGMKLVEEREDIDVYRVTSWQPFEVSLVSIPADDTVGIGRSLEKPQEEQTRQNGETARAVEPNSQTKANTKMEKTLKDGAGNLVRARVDEQGKIIEVLEVLEVAARKPSEADAERQRARSLVEMGKTYGRADLAAQFVADGKSVDEFRAQLLHDFAAQRSARPLDEQQQGASVGMSQKEVRAYSMMRAIRVLADPTNKEFIKDAGLEIEASRAAAELYGKNPKGLIIPNDVLADRAFASAGAGGTGSNIIAQQLLDGSFIDLLRKRAWVLRRATVMAGLVGNVDIPRQNAAGQAYWVGEGSAPTGSQMSTDQIHFTPKTVGAYTDITRRLMMQSTPDAERLVRNDLLKIMGLEVDRVAIYGSGSANQPLGLANISGLPAKAFGTANQPTFNELVSMETTVALADADVDSMAYAGNASFRGYCKTALKFAGNATSSTIWEQGNTVNGYDTSISNQVAAGDVLFGNFADLVIAMWGGLELTVDPYALSTSGGLRLIALQDVDMNVRHKESFVIGR